MFIVHFLYSLTNNPLSEDAKDKLADVARRTGIDIEVTP